MVKRCRARLGQSFTKPRDAAGVSALARGLLLVTGVERRPREHVRATSAGARWAGTLVALLLPAACAYKSSPSKGGGQVSEERAGRKVRPSAADIDVPRGYRIELVARGLTFPTGITFGPKGTAYVVESGYSYGEVLARARIIELDVDTGEVKREIATGTHAPWNGIAFHDGALFVSEGGATEQVGRLARYDLDGTEHIIVDNIPTGDHHTNGPIVVDGWLYFTQGTATNSGVVGIDNYAFGWLKRDPKMHDVPCKDITLVGTNFESENPFTDDKGDKATTGAYLPFGTPSTAGQKLDGKVPCTGSAMRVRPDGSSLELVAWGFRNPFGMAEGVDGIYITDNGYDTRGSRPVFGTPEVLWKLEPGAWYGWPDYVGGRPVTADDYAEAEGDPKGFVLAEHPGKVPPPRALLPVHSSANGFDFARGDAFGYQGQAFVALFGDMAPTVGKVIGPVGFDVIRVDLRTGIYRDFARNRGDEAGPASKLGSKGLERPVAVRFDPSGENLYVVDFGVVRMTEKGAQPEPATGAIWRISREEAPHATR
jgi:glucose/arabinose dehydrogenase